MLDFTQINNQKFAEAVRKSAEAVLRNSDISGGAELYSSLTTLDKQRDKINPELQPLYDEARRDAFFTALPSLIEKEIADQLASYLPYILENENYDLVEKFRHKMSLIEVIEDRDDFRRVLRDSLMRSDEILTVASITLETEKKAGAIKEWLRYYMSVVGGTKTDPLKRSEFLISRPLSLLSENEKQKVVRLAKFFDYLKLSSNDPEVIENEFTADFGDEIWTLRGGKLDRVNVFEDSLYTEEIPKLMSGLRKAWARQAAEPTDLEKEAREQQAKGLNPAAAQQTIAGIFANKGSKDQKGGLAALYSAISGGLDSFLKQILPTLQDYIKGGPEAERVLPLLQTGLITPALAKLFFQTYLVKFLGFSSDHAAALVGRLLGALPPTERDKYFKIAFYDFEKGWFVWGEV